MINTVNLVKIIDEYLESKASLHMVAKKSKVNLSPNVSSLLLDVWCHQPNSVHD